MRLLRSNHGLFRAGISTGAQLLAIPDPRDLFLDGSQGGWYDPSDLSTLFQDAGGVTPVTAIGQPVGLMLDKSGRNNHMAQATATARPVLQADANGFYYLKFDGVDDYMSKSITEITISKYLLSSGCYTPNVHTGFKSIISLSHSVNSAHYTYIHYVSTNRMYLTHYDSVIGKSVSFIGTDITTPHTFSGESTTETLRVRKNNNSLATSAVTGGTLTLNRLMIGSHQAGSNGFGSRFDGAFYGGVILMREPTVQEIKDTNDYMARKMGVTI